MGSVGSSAERRRPLPGKLLLCQTFGGHVTPGERPRAFFGFCQELDTVQSRFVVCELASVIFSTHAPFDGDSDRDRCGHCRGRRPRIVLIAAEEAEIR